VQPLERLMRRTGGRTGTQGLDEYSLSEFVHGEYPRIVAAVALVCGSKAAEDAVQEALARAWERSTKGEEIASVGAWVTTCR